MKLQRLQRKKLINPSGSEKLEKCPCTKDCADRNAKCHNKGNCPHGYDVWWEEHLEEKERIYKVKQAALNTRTAAKDRRHFNYIKYGQGNSKR